MGVPILFYVADDGVTVRDTKNQHVEGTVYRAMLVG